MTVEYDEWFLLKTRPRQELRAVENLNNQGFVAYCPQLKKRTGREEVLFPGYVFLRADRDRDDELPWQRVRSTRGVSGFVRFGANEPRILPLGLVENIQDRERKQADSPAYSKGQKVVFESGPFAELEGVYMQDKGENRCIVLIQILNRQQTINTEQAFLR